MLRGSACRLCGKIVGGNAGSMVKHQSTWQCAARRPRSVPSTETQDKRQRLVEPEPEGYDCREDDLGDAQWVDVDAPGATEPPLDEGDIVPAPDPLPHDPGHTVRKRMRLRFLELLRINTNLEEAALISDEPITSTEVPDAEYDAEDGIASEESDVDSRNSDIEASPLTQELENESRRAKHILRDHIQVLFHPPTGAGLAAAKRKEVLQIIQLALTAGHACPDITVLDLFPDTGGESISGTLASIDNQFKKHMALLTRDDGWVSQDFTVRGGAATCHWNTRAVDALARKVCDMLGIIDTRSRWDGQTFSHPTSGAFMREFSEMLQFQRRAYGDWDPENDLPILLTYFSDATLLANKGSMSAHPVVVGIGNVPASSYPDTFVTVGYLDPKLTFDSGLSDDDAAQVKRALVSQQVGAMVEQFKRCSFMGYSVCGPNGRKFRIFTGLFDCAIDNPEVSLLLGHKSGYCGSCYWKTELGVGERRTESRTRKVLERMQDSALKADSKALIGQFGCHPQPSGLWGFNGSCSPTHLPDYLPSRLATIVAASTRPSATRYLDIHAVVSTERMHEVDVGIAVYVRDLAFDLLRSSGLSEKEVEKLNTGLWNCLNFESRWQGLVHPPKKRETAILQGYLGGITRVEASEHRTMLQVMVPVCCRFLGFKHPVTRMYALFVKYYCVRERRLTSSNSHTNESLVETERLFELVHACLQRHQPIDEKTLEPKLLDTPKIHAQRHFTEAVIRVGTTAISTGEAGEANNAKVKAPYVGRRTNRQTAHVTEQLARRQREAEATCRLQIQLPPAEAGRAYDTSFLIAARTDVCSLTKHTNVRGRSRTSTYEIMNFVEKAIGTSKNPREMAQVDLTSAKGFYEDLTIASDPEAAKMQFSENEKQMRLVLGSPQIARYFLQELSHFFMGTGNAEDFKRATDPVIEIKIVTNAVCPSVAFGDSRVVNRSRILQRLRANPRFRVSQKSRKGPERLGLWMDFVAIAGERPHRGDDLYYARLLLLFHAQDPVTGTWTQMAFVRYLSRVESKGDEEKRWASADDEPRLTKLKYSVRMKKGSENWWYGVILVQSIVRKVHVVAGNQTASDSLLKSRGEDIYRNADKEALFFFNHYVWEAKNASKYEIEVQPSA